MRHDGASLRNPFASIILSLQTATQTQPMHFSFASFAHTSRLASEVNGVVPLPGKTSSYERNKHVFDRLMLIWLATMARACALSGPLRSASKKILGRPRERYSVFEGHVFYGSFISFHIWKVFNLLAPNDH